MALDRSDFTIDSGFKVLAKEAIDSRMLLTKAQMLNVGSEGFDQDFMPGRYLAICADSDTVGLYLFDEANDWSSEGTDIGKFRWLAGLSADTLGPGFKFEDGKLELVLDPEDFVLDSEGFLHSTLTASEGIFIDPQGYISVKLDPEAFIFNSEGQISVDPDWLPFVIGNGVKVENDTLMANIDEATIQFDPSGRLFARPITVSEGLSITGDGFLYLRLGEKVTFDSEGRLTLENVADAFTPGDGLEIDNDVLKLVLDNDSLVISEGKLQVGDLHNKISVSEGLIFNNNDVISLNIDNDTLILSEGKLKLGSVHGILSVSEGLILSGDGVISLDIDDSLVFSEGKLSVGNLDDIISVSEGLIFENNVLSLDLDNDTIILSEGKLKLGSVHGVLSVSKGLVLSSEGVISLDLDRSLKFNSEGKLQVGRLDGVLKVSEGLSLNSENLLSLVLDNDTLKFDSEGRLAVGDLHNVFSVSDGLIFDSEDTLSLNLDRSLAFNSEGKLKIGRLDGIIKVSEGLSLDSENLLSLVLDNDTVFINSEGKVKSKQFKFAVSEGFKFSSEGLLSLDLDNDTLIISEGKLSLRDLSEILSVSEGLAFDSEGTLKLVLGDHIIVDSEGKLTLEGVAKAFTVSEGLELTSEGYLRVIIDNGLKFNSEGKIEINLSDIVSTDGLQVGSEGKVELKIDSDKLQINSEGELTLVEQGVNFKTSEGLKLSSEGWLSVKFDNDTIKLNSEGKLYANIEGFNLHVSEGLRFTSEGLLSILLGDTLEINSEGRIDVDNSNLVSGQGIEVDSEGKLIIKVNNDTIKIDSEGQLYANIEGFNLHVSEGLRFDSEGLLSLVLSDIISSEGGIKINSEGKLYAEIPEFDLSVSEGLDLTSEGLLSLKLGDTLKFNSEDQIEVDPLELISSEGGLKLDSEGKLIVNVDNDTIKINSEGQLYAIIPSLNTSEGLNISSEGLLSIIHGDTLMFTSEGELEVNLSNIISSEGLKIIDNKINLNIDSESLMFNSEGKLSVIKQEIGDGLIINSENILSVYATSEFTFTSEGKLHLNTNNKLGFTAEGKLDIPWLAYVPNSEDEDKLLAVNKDGLAEWSGFETVDDLKITKKYFYRKVEIPHIYESAGLTNDIIFTAWIDPENNPDLSWSNPSAYCNINITIQYRAREFGWDFINSQTMDSPEIDFKHRIMISYLTQSGFKQIYTNPIKHTIEYPLEDQHVYDIYSGVLENVEIFGNFSNTHKLLGANLPMFLAWQRGAAHWNAQIGRPIEDTPNGYLPSDKSPYKAKEIKVYTGSWPAANSSPWTELMDWNDSNNNVRILSGQVLSESESTARQPADALFSSSAYTLFANSELFNLYIKDYVISHTIKNKDLRTVTPAPSSDNNFLFELTKLTDAYGHILDTFSIIPTLYQNVTIKQEIQTIGTSYKPISNTEVFVDSTYPYTWADLKTFIYWNRYPVKLRVWKTFTAGAFIGTPGNIMTSSDTGSTTDEYNPLLHATPQEFYFVKGTYLDSWRSGRLVLIFTTADGAYTIKLTSDLPESQGGSENAITGVWIKN